MNSFILPLLMGVPQGDPNAPVTGGSLIGSLLPIVAIIAIFYFLIIRPQNKKRKETEKMHSNLKKGDRIVTIGGLYGVIHSVKDTTVIIKADDNVKLEFLRSAISSVTIPAPVKEDKIEEKEEKDKEKSDSQKSDDKTSENGE
ncbi:MAG: preprotein translocase subunit YajC [Treponema sp.]|nr:preprotein translocase subunit YajC [Treponema sp.]